MKRVRFYLRHPTDADRVDVVEVEDGAVLVDSQSAMKYTPLITVSQLVRLEYVDDEAGAAVAATPTPRPENVMEPHISPVSAVPVHADPDTPSRWGAFPLGKRSDDAS